MGSPKNRNDPMKGSRCGAKTRSGGRCGRAPAPGRSRCHLHGGAAGSGGQPGNQNARRHGAYSDRRGLLSRLPPDDLAEIEGLDVESSAEDALRLETWLAIKAQEQVEQAQGLLADAVAEASTEQIEIARLKVAHALKGLSVHLELISKQNLRLSQSMAIRKKAKADSGEGLKETLEESAAGTRNLLRAAFAVPPPDYHPEVGWIDAWGRVVAEPDEPCPPADALPPPPGHARNPEVKAS